MPVQSQTYEIIFTGEAGTTLRAEFDDCAITLGPGTTTLRAQLWDQAALFELVQRITGLGLEVVHLHLVAPLPQPWRSPAHHGRGTRLPPVVRSDRLPPSLHPSEGDVSSAPEEGG